MYFVSCPKQRLKIEDVLHRVGSLEYFCLKQDQDFKPSAAPLYPNMGQVPPSPGRGKESFLMILLRGPIVNIPKQTSSSSSSSTLILAMTAITQDDHLTAGVWDASCWIC